MLYSNSFFESWQGPLIRKLVACECFVPLTGTVLFVTDRIPQVAEALAACFTHCTACAVLGVAQNQCDAQRLTAGRHLDFLIFAGYQLSGNNYRIHLPGAARVLWSSADPATQADCLRYSIPHQFEKFACPKDFFCFLQSVSIAVPQAVSR